MLWLRQVQYKYGCKLIKEFQNQMVELQLLQGKTRMTCVACDGSGDAQIAVNFDEIVDSHAHGTAAAAGKTVPEVAAAGSDNSIGQAEG